MQRRIDSSSSELEDLRILKKDLHGPTLELVAQEFPFALLRQLAVFLGVLADPEEALFPMVLDKDLVEGHLPAPLHSLQHREACLSPMGGGDCVSGTKGS